MSLCLGYVLNMLSRLVITFLPRSKRLLISWLQSPSAVILEPKKIKSVTVSTVSPSICHEVMGLDAMILVFWMERQCFYPNECIPSVEFSDSDLVGGCVRDRIAFQISTHQKPLPQLGFVLFFPPRVLCVRRVCMIQASVFTVWRNSEPHCVWLFTKFLLRKKMSTKGLSRRAQPPPVDASL